MDILWAVIYASITLVLVIVLAPLIFKDKFNDLKANREVKRINALERLEAQADAAERSSVLDEREAILRERINRAKVSKIRLAKAKAGSTTKASSSYPLQLSEPKRKPEIKPAPKKWTIGGVEVK